MASIRRELAYVVVAFNCSLCQAQKEAVVELVQKVSSAYRVHDPYRMQVRTFTLKPEASPLDATSLSADDIERSIGTEIENREVLVHPGAGVLLDFTPAEVRQAKGRLYLAIWKGRRYYECSQGAGSPALLSDKDTGGFFISPANYAPSSIPDELASAIEAKWSVEMKPDAEGCMEIIFDRVTYQVSLSDFSVRKITEKLSGGKRAVKTYVGVSGVKVSAAPFPRYMVTSIFSGQSGEPDFQSVIKYEAPVVDKNMDRAELDWWKYRETALDLNTKLLFGREDVKVDAVATPGSHRRGAEAVLDPKALAASVNDPSTIVLPKASRGFRTFFLGLGLACLAGAVALLLRRASTRGSAR
ncbi:MAG: hypothetical protein KF678_12525 [Phycisphaeraceae bacterium]|nr:hypothetical protein [Phycisphaeraceae bacterium]